jgi:hypothetical protein
MVVVAIVFLTQHRQYHSLGQSVVNVASMRENRCRSIGFCLFSPHTPG